MFEIIKTNVSFARFLFLKCYQVLAGQHIKMVGWFWGEGCYSNSKFSSNGFTACNVKNF